MHITLPNFFIGDQLVVNRGTIEHKILWAKRPNVSALHIGNMQCNLVVIFQALHRTQQHRVQYHTAAGDVAAVLGFEGTEGANAVAGIIDHYCAARLAFHRQNNQYHYRQLLHVLVDEEIRWRLECGSNSQILDPRRNQPQAKQHYAAETKAMITSRFHELMTQELPPTVHGQASPRNRYFGVLKGINLNRPMLPMRAMESGAVPAHKRMPDPKDYSVTNFIEQFNAKKAADKAAEAEKAAKAETTAQSSTKTSAADTAEDVPAPVSPQSPVPDNVDENADKNVANISSEEANDDVAIAEAPAPFPAISASNGNDHIFTDEQASANELRRAAEDAVADQRRKDQQRIAALQAEIAGFKRAQEQWSQGLTSIKDERDRLAREVPALRQISEQRRHEADAAKILARQTEEDSKALEIENDVLKNSHQQLSKQLQGSQELGRQRLVDNQALEESNRRLEADNEQLRGQNERLEEVTSLERAYKDALKRIEALEDEKEADGQIFRADVAAYQTEVEAYMADHHARREQGRSTPAGPAGPAPQGDQE